MQRKRLLTFAVACLVVIVLRPHVFGQGRVLFNNIYIFPASAPVTISAVPGAANPSDGPAGAYVGSNYTVSLFFVTGTVTNQTAFDSLNPTWVADAVFFGATGIGPGHGIPGDGSGFFDGDQVNLPVANLFITVQVRAWYNGNGLYSCYAQALAAGHNTGVSNFLPMYVLLPPGPANNLEGLQPFTVGIPEPSTILLAALGGVALLLFRRHR